MSPRISLKWSLIAAGVLGLVSPLLIIFVLTLNLPNQSSYIRPISPTVFIESLKRQIGGQDPYSLIKGLVDSSPIESLPIIVVLKHALPSAPVATIPARQIGQVGVPAQSDPRLPVRIKIPKINVDAAIEYVGLTTQGAMGVPYGPSNVAWFDLGSIPGEIGSAVMAGHYGWKDGIPAVFDNIYKLHKGDRISVQSAEGTTITYVVREIQLYGENEDASNVFDSSDGKAHLNLITCEGVWNDVRKSYSKRLIVFTDKEQL